MRYIIGIFFCLAALSACGLSSEEQQAVNQELLVGSRISYKQRAQKAVVEALDKGASIDALDEQGRTALHWAAYYKNQRLVRLLVAEGANVNLADNAGLSVLHIGADNQYLEEIKPLLEGSYAQQKTGRSVPDFDSPLYTPEDHLAVVRFLVEQKADINAVDKFGRTVLGLVRSRDAHDAAVADFLESSGANPGEEEFGFDFPAD